MLLKIKQKCVVQTTQHFAFFEKKKQVSYNQF